MRRVGGGSVFISYSRQDFHFAESLTRHLVRSGVPAWMDVKNLEPGLDWQRTLYAAIDACSTFVLVASPAALDSPHVRAELARAQSQGKRIVLLGWHRRITLQGNLQQAEWLDVRGRFTPALSRLVAALAPGGPALPLAGARPGRWPIWPPDVLAALLALLAPILALVAVVVPRVTAYFVAEWPFERGDLDVLLVLLALFYIVLAASAFALIGALVWWLCLSLAHRRMGMTRLALNLSYVAFIFAWPLLHLAWQGEAGLAHTPDWVREVLLAQLPLSVVLTGLPMATLAWMGLAPPEGLLRWMPTGKAWTRARRQAEAGNERQITDSTTALAAVRRFRLLHDEADAPLAARLRATMLQGGAVESPADDADATVLVLITNHSRKEWLAKEVNTLTAGNMITVVGSQIGDIGNSRGLARKRLQIRQRASGERSGHGGAISWLWRRHWIDLRHWPAHGAIRAPDVIALPEATTLVRPPAPVARLHVLLCAAAVMPMWLAQTVVPEGQKDNVTLLVMLVALPAVWLARNLVRRGITANTLRWGLALQLPASLLTGAALLVVPDVMAPGMSTPALAALVVATVLSLLAWRSLPAATFWLPAPGAPSSDDSGPLAAPSDWRTSATVTVVSFIWLGVLDLFTPATAAMTSGAPANGVSLDGQQNVHRAAIHAARVSLDSRTQAQPAPLAHPSGQAVAGLRMAGRPQVSGHHTSTTVA